LIGSKDNNENGQVLLYQSQDLYKWEYVNCIAKSHGNMGNTWECPEIFQLKNKDVLMVSPQYLKAKGNDYNNLHSTIYMLGNLNLNKEEFAFAEFLPVDYGFDFYAPQTLLDSKGRHIMVGWMDMWETPKPTQRNEHNWAGAMTLPREIILVGNRLNFMPVDEIKDYRQSEYYINNLKLNGEEILNAYGDSYELEVCFDVINAHKFGLKLRVSDVEETILYYNVEEKLFYFNRDKSGNGITGERRTNIALIDNKLRLRIFVDKSSVEVFINSGEKVMTGRIYPSKDAIGIQAFSEGDCILTLKKWDIA
jgi:beta-fructofuranosidase